MDRFPLSVGGDGSGASSSKQPSLPDLNLPTTEEDPEDQRDLKRKAAEEEVLQVELQKVEDQKSRLAQLIRPLIEKEANKYQPIRKIPSSREIVEDLIHRLGTPLVKKANGPHPEWGDLQYLKTWLTRACQNAEDEMSGRMNIRSEIRDIISKCVDEN